jgi:hypothetical protein
MDVGGRLEANDGGGVVLFSLYVFFLKKIDVQRGTFLLAMSHDIARINGTEVESVFLGYPFISFMTGL